MLSAIYNAALLAGCKLSVRLWVQADRIIGVVYFLSENNADSCANPKAWESMFLRILEIVYILEAICCTAAMDDGLTMKPALNRTLITLATYNEIENLPDLVSEIFQVVAGIDILVIDDNSPDGTGRWCDAMHLRDARLICLHREGKMGLGTAILAGMKYAIDHGYDQVLNMDADFSHHPRHLPAILSGMDVCSGGRPTDVMIGSRYVPGGSIQGWPWRRHFMSRAVNGYARTLLGLRPRDCSGSYRCYRTSVLRRLDFGAVRSGGYSFQEEILFLLKRAGATMRETPITFADRTRGSSKISTKEAVAALRVIFTLGAGRLFGRHAATLPGVGNTA